jgi:hypothetical protein
MKSARIRAILLVLLLALCGAGGYFLLFPAAEQGYPFSAEAGPWPRDKPMEKCGECHMAIHSQWKSSYHGLAWTDNNVRQLDARFDTTVDCQPCHAPEPVFLTGLENLPVRRRHSEDEGVNCNTCHYTREGAAGKKNAPAAWCKAVDRKRDLESLTLCRGCHNQHQTVDEWETSRYFKDPKQFKSCSDCHMPWLTGIVAQGTPARKYRDHSLLGGHDLAFIRTACVLEAHVEKGTLFVAVENTGCGHNFPTDSRHRSAFVEVDFPDRPAVNPVVLDKFRNPYRDEPGENTQLKPGELRTYSHVLGAGKGSVRVRLLYSPHPYPRGYSEALEQGKKVVVLEKTLEYGK